MLTALPPTLPGPGPTAAPASTVKNPYLKESPATPSSQDSVQLSAPRLSASAPKAPRGEHKALIATGVIAVVLAGVMAPIIGGVVSQISPPTAPSISISQTVTQAVQSTPLMAAASADAVTAGLQQIEHPATLVQQDPLQKQIQDFATMTKDPTVTGDGNVGPAIAKTVASDAQQLLDVNKTQAQWSSDVAAMKSTYKTLFANDDAIMRGNGDATAHHAALDQSIATLTQQFSDFQKRVQTDQPVVDQSLAPIRDSLNQAGLIEFNLHQRVDQSALQYNTTQAEHQMLGDVSVKLHTASIDLAMATEKTTDARTVDKNLVGALQKVSTLFDQLQKANTAAKKDASAMTQVDQATTLVGQALNKLQAVTQQSQQNLTDASARAQHAATEASSLPAAQ